MCTGYGGLDLAVSAVLDVETAWVADPDPGAAAILAHHWPDVPNLGDITAVDWTTVPPVDVVAAGFPCTDLSLAGAGAGITEGTQSGLWLVIAAALGVLRPRLVVLENVRAIVARRPGLDRVLSDLARLGFDAEWTCVRASDAGAAHQRWRWYLLAWPADADRPRLEGPRLRGTTPERRRTAADPARDRWHQGRPEPTRVIGRPDVALGGAAAARTDRHGRQVLQRDQSGMGTRDHADRCGPALDWGAYAPAIDRWARILGRPAPAPTEPGRDGRPRLSPPFVEWLMGLPAGWVTDPAIWTALAETSGKRRARFTPTSARNAQLKALGNGVVWQQGAAALAGLLDRLAADRPLSEGSAA
ncbi:DNA cytosine methyltransferase [Actinomadura sp. NAK00032]|nr:DNA cytosine methyltransferase [Actinomadura sp. NAK00032]